jgi:intracellular sulfur oxidation DsrE/DsrF family protein
MSHGNNQIQIVDLADNVNAAVDKINENFELVETGTFSSVDSSSVTNIVNNILDSDYFTTIINEDYINNITTNLNVDLTDVEAGIAANASAISSLTTSINSTDSGITILSQQITATQASVDGLILDGFDSDALISAVTSANSSITSRIDADSDSLVVFSQILDSVESQLLIIDSDLGVRIDAEASARNSLSSTVATQGNTINSLSGDITELDNAVFMFDSNGDPLLDSNGNPQTAIASATDSLTISIESTIDGKILAANNEQTTVLETKIGTDIAAAEQTLQTSIDNIGNTTASWNLELIAGTESDPRFAGIQFGNDGQQADFALTADKFKIINPDSTTDSPIIPFSVDADGATLTNVKVTGNLDIGANLSGAHMEMKDDVTKIFDSSGQLRVQLGRLDV